MKSVINSNLHVFAFICTALYFAMTPKPARVSEREREGKKWEKHDEMAFRFYYLEAL